MILTTQVKMTGAVTEKWQYFGQPTIFDFELITDVLFNPSKAF